MSRGGLLRGSGADFCQDALELFRIGDELIDEVGFGEFLSGLEALAAGAFGRLTIGNAGEVQEGVGWIVEELVSGAALNFPECTERVEGGQPFGSILECRGVFEFFDGFGGAFGAEFFEIELFLGSKPVFITAFSPAGDAVNGQAGMTEFGKPADDGVIGAAVVEHDINEIANLAGESGDLPLPDAVRGV